MAQNAIVRWSNPKVMLVATNLVEGKTFIVHTIRQAMLSRAKVFLVHAIPPSYLRSDAVHGARCFQPSLVARNAREQLDALAAEFHGHGVECEPVILNGLPEEQIPLFVKSQTVDRIIVAARQAGGVERLIGGSVAGALISGAEVPVCTIGCNAHTNSEVSNPPRRILVAASLRADSLMLVHFASLLAELHQSHLTLLHVLHSTGMTEQEREQARFKLRQVLVGLIPKEARHRHQPVLLIPEGDPAEVIADAAVTMAQDLVILGGSIPSLFSWILGTSVVHRVIAQASCPVITIKAPAGASSGRAYHREAIESDATLAIAGGRNAVISRR